MRVRVPNQKTIVLVVAVLAITGATAYAVSQVWPNEVTKAQIAPTSSLGQSIQEMTQGIIGRTNQQVQNTLESAGQQALPQLQANASQYDCLVVIMHFGKAHGAMTCSPGEQFSSSITVNSANAPGGSAQSSSSIQQQGGALSMQNQFSGSGSSANVIPGDVP